MIPGSTYHEIDSPFGHDGFLVEHEQLNDILLPFHEQSINKYPMTKIKIGLFGFGVVGQGIYQVVQKSKNAHAEIVKICVRDPKNRARSKSTTPLFTTSVDEILDNRNINLVVEVIDDADAAYNIVKRAMLRGIPVVRAARRCWRKHLPELIEIQKTHNVALLYDASSCGSIPRDPQPRGVL